MLGLGLENCKHETRGDMLGRYSVSSGKGKKRLYWDGNSFVECKFSRKRYKRLGHANIMACRLKNKFPQERISVISEGCGGRGKARWIEEVVYDKLELPISKAESQAHSSLTPRQLNLFTLNLCISLIITLPIYFTEVFGLNFYLF
jgi:hypothetical protein